MTWPNLTWPDLTWPSNLTGKHRTKIWKKFKVHMPEKTFYHPSSRVHQWNKSSKERQKNLERMLFERTTYPVPNLWPWEVWIYFKKCNLSNKYTVGSHVDNIFGGNLPNLNLNVSIGCLMGIRGHWSHIVCSNPLLDT